MFNFFGFLPTTANVEDAGQIAYVRITDDCQLHGGVVTGRIVLVNYTDRCLIRQQLDTFYKSGALGLVLIGLPDANIPSAAHLDLLPNSIPLMLIVDSNTLTALNLSESTAQHFRASLTTQPGIRIDLAGFPLIPLLFCLPIGGQLYRSDDRPVRGFYLRVHWVFVLAVLTAAIPLFTLSYYCRLGMVVVSYVTFCVLATVLITGLIWAIVDYVARRRGVPSVPPSHSNTPRYVPLPSWLASVTHVTHFDLFTLIPAPFVLTVLVVAALFLFRDWANHLLHNTISALVCVELIHRLRFPNQWIIVILGVGALVVQVFTHYFQIPQANISKACTNCSSNSSMPGWSWLTEVGRRTFAEGVSAPRYTVLPSVHPFPFNFLRGHIFFDVKQSMFNLVPGVRVSLGWACVLLPGFLLASVNRWESARSKMWQVIVNVLVVFVCLCGWIAADVADWFTSELTLRPYPNHPRLLFIMPPVLILYLLLAWQHGQLTSTTGPAARAYETTILLQENGDGTVVMGGTPAPPTATREL